MSQNTPETTPAAEGPKGGVPQAIADDIAVLAAEVKAVQAKASSSWKISLVLWIVLLAVIFSYLQFGVMNRLVKPLLEPENLVGLMKVSVDRALQTQGLPSIDSAGFADQVAQKLQAYAPQLMEGQVKPYVQNLLAKAPDLRKKAVTYVTENSQAWSKNLLDTFEAQYVPKLDDYIQSYVKKTADDLMNQVQDDFQNVVVELVSTVHQNASDLGDQEAVEVALANAIEEAMGEHLNEMFEGLDQKVGKLRGDLEGMIQRMQERQLTDRDRLEILLIQDVRMLFESREFDLQMQERAGIFDGLREYLRGLGTPEVTTERIVREAQAGSPLDLSTVPEEKREEVRQQAEAARAAAAAAAAQAAGTARGRRGGPPTPAPRGAAPPTPGPRGAAPPTPGPRAGRGGPPSPEEIAKRREEGIQRAREAQEKAKAAEGNE